MKFWAKVGIEDEKNAGKLVRAFFREFNPESSIVIKGKEAKVEIIFDKSPPMEVIDAIGECKVIEFYFGKLLGEYSQDEINQEVAEEVSSVQTELAVAVSEVSEQSRQVVDGEATFQDGGQSTKKRGRLTNKKEDDTRIVNKKMVNIPQLEEIAKKATSFEHFVKLVAEWLKMEKWQNFFENLVIVATEVDKISWKELEKELREKGLSCSQYEKVQTMKLVSKKLNDNSITMIPLLNAMRQYKDYSFGHEQPEKEDFTEQETEGEVAIVGEKISSEGEETIPKNRVKMKCMPEIIHFEETLGSVDKTQPIEERIRYVLTSMGWNEKDLQEQRQIFEITNAAVRLERIDYDDIFIKAKIPAESSMKARMTFAKFVNDFVSEYDPNIKVKLSDFLEQLKKIIM